MTPYQSQRVRFGILAARHELERHRLTPDQVEDLEGMEFEGWQKRDSRRAYNAEWFAALCRIANTP